MLRLTIANKPTNLSSHIFKYLTANGKATLEPLSNRLKVKITLKQKDTIQLVLYIMGGVVRETVNDKLN